MPTVSEKEGYTGKLVVSCRSGETSQSEGVPATEGVLALGLASELDGEDSCCDNPPVCPACPGIKYCES